MKVGITHSKDYFPKRYISAVEAIGAEAVLISTNEHSAQKESLNALLFSGGGDIAPQIYGQEPHPLTKEPDTERDDLELELAAFAQKRGMPILGICRGIQLMNCALGGTLDQHLLDSHLHEGVTEDLWHDIIIEADSMMMGLYGNHTLVNSWHHQAVGRIASALRVTAFAGACIEALEGENMLLVQFHPERMGEQGVPVFQWLQKALSA